MDFGIRQIWFNSQFQLNCTVLNMQLKHSEFSTCKMGIRIFIKSVLNANYVSLWVLRILMRMSRETEYTDEELQRPVNAVKDTNAKEA